MSEYINQQFKAMGVAQVIAVLKTPAALAGTTKAGVAIGVGAIPLPSPADAPALAGLENHFQNSELSQKSALAAAAGINSAVSLQATSAVAVAPTRRPRKAVGPSPVRYFPNLGVLFGTVTLEGLASLRADERVATVTGAPQIGLIHPKRVAAAKLASDITWGIDFLKVPRLWQEGLTGKGVRVAHLDTGVDGKHPALKKAIGSFGEFDMIGELVDPSPDPFDTGDHGTHTAATIAGRETGGKKVGVAPGAELSSAIVVEGGEVVARVLAGMDWALTQGVRVLSMSLGFRGWWEDFIPITQILRSQNILSVIAVGNEGPGTSRSPGNYPEVLSVGAIDKHKSIAPFSSSQKFKRADNPIVPDLVAPGVDIMSAKPGGGYQSMDGTSMATPHIAGLAALLFEAAPHASISDVETAIYNSCKLDPSMLSDLANRGYPSAVQALYMLTGVKLTTSKGAAKKGELAKKVPRKKAITKKSAAKKSSAKASGKGGKVSKR